MPGKPKKKKTENKKMRPSQSLYINCNNTDIEAKAMKVINEYKEARTLSTIRAAMCEFIIEHLPVVTKKYKKNKAS